MHVIALEGNSASTRPRGKRLRLTTAIDCRRELATLYVEARYGRLDPAHACKLAFLLNSIVGVLASVEFEQRIRTLESKLCADGQR